jgi:hypothetical protein
MKSIYLITCLISLISVESISQKINNLGEKNLRGKVRTIESEMYLVKDRFGEIKKDTLMLKITDCYNDKGYITKSGGYHSFLLNYLPDSSGQKIYKYNEKNDLVEVTTSKLDGSIYDKVIYKYDDKGNQIEYNYYQADGALRYKIFSQYDLKGNKKEKISYRHNGEWTYKTVYGYDERGNLLEEVEVAEWGGFIWKKTYSYDEKNNVIEKKCYEGDNFSYSNSYKYDKFGNEIEIKYIDNDGPSIRTYVYKFDEKSNWTERIEYEGFLPVTIVERRFSYFPD